MYSFKQSGVVSFCGVAFSEAISGTYQIGLKSAVWIGIGPIKHRLISKARADKPLRRKSKILKLSQKDLVQHAGCAFIKPCLGASHLVFSTTVKRLLFWPGGQIQKHVSKT